MSEAIIYTDPLDEQDHIWVPNILGIYPQIRYDSMTATPQPTAKNLKQVLQDFRDFNIKLKK